MKKQLVVLALLLVIACAFTACYSLPTYKVTFDFQDESGNTLTINFDKNFEAPTASKGNKVFGGWYTDKNCTDGNEWVVPKSLTENITVYAKWLVVADLSEVFAQYDSYDKWNFQINYYAIGPDGSALYDDVLQFDSWDFSMQYEYFGVSYTDYIVFSTETPLYIADNGDGSYTNYTEGTDDYEYAMYYIDYVELCQLSSYAFVSNNGCYSAISANEVGNEVLDEWEDCLWTSFDIYVSDGLISQIVAVQQDCLEDYAGTYVFTLTFSKYNQITLSIPNLGESGGESGATVMPNQFYDEESFDNSNLQDKMEAYAQDDDTGIGLPSIGTYSALVVPVQFSNTSITDSQWENLNIAFNGTEDQTGWESVKTYYQKDSYNNLNLSFDIWGYNIGTKNQAYVSSKRYQYYENLTDSEGYLNGNEVILLEVLDYLQDKIDLTKYDTNSDGCIDAVYLIYSAPVNYQDDDSIWWAYVTWYYGENKYDSLYPYYYMFTGFDFMEEEMRSGVSVAVNAETFIHETGHLLGLDDYYDYAIGTGSDRGMGGASMQDFDVGEHDSYSKIMMGWLKPTVITTTQTFTINLSNDSTDDDCVMILLDSNNSYFCEYLLLDLYVSTGLNELSYSYMYGGAAYGVRMYHVSSWCDKPYSDEYYSFTNYNNSISDIPLITLVEADGETTKNNNRNDGEWAESSDLWRTGNSLQQSFANYTRNDGKVVNFNIEFVEVTSTTATITVTFVEE